MNKVINKPVITVEVNQVLHEDIVHYHPILYINGRATTIGDEPTLFKSRFKAYSFGTKEMNRIIQEGVTCSAECPSDIKNGDAVIVTKDDDSELKTTARSDPWFEPNNNRWVIMVKGIAGYYLLERVKKVPTDEEETARRNGIKVADMRGYAEELMAAGYRGAFIGLVTPMGSTIRMSWGNLKGLGIRKEKE
jgi:hypothetical protein